MDKPRDEPSLDGGSNVDKDATNVAKELTDVSVTPRMAYLRDCRQRSHREI